MKIRGGQRDVAQRRYFEHVLVFAAFRNLVAVGGRILMPVRNEEPHFLIRIPADIDAVVAGNAAKRFKTAIAAQFQSAQCLFTPQKTVEAAVGRHQCLFEGDDGVDHLGITDAIAPVDLLERFFVRRIGVEALLDDVGVHRHLDRIVNRPVRLIAERFGPPVPKLPEIVTGVIDRRRLDVALFAADADGDGTRVGTPCCVTVTARTGDAAVFRKYRIFEKPLAEQGLVPVVMHLLRQRCNRLGRISLSPNSDPDSYKKY